MIRKEIEKYYNSGVEKNRLFDNRCQLERVRTQEIILRFIHKTPSKILDVGGATGFYSFWLNDLGHEVHLLDPIPMYIKEAKRYSRESHKKLASITVGEAGNLEYDDDYFDIALLLGPLYHLVEKEERIRALNEARRVLSKGGLLICVGISRYAPMLDGFFRNLVKDPHYIEIMNRDLKDGQHRNPTSIKGYFTTAYFHTPDELRKEITDAGFNHKALIAIESFGCLLPEFNDKWQDEEYRELLLNTLRTIESDATMIGIGGHFMAIASK